MNSTQQKTIAFIGAGNMASCLIGGLVAHGYDPQKIMASNPSLPKLEKLQQQFAITITQDNGKAAAMADIVVLAVKPQKMQAVAAELADIIVERTPFIISIASRIDFQQLESWFGAQCAIVRCMPNTPALVGCGASVLFANAATTAAQKITAEEIFQCVGMTAWVDNADHYAAATALSGCGPAYFFLFMELLEKAGQQLGLSPELARALTLQTAVGAAQLAEKKGEDFATLRQQVVSKEGPTDRALQVFERAGLKDIFLAALTAAKQRSLEAPA